MAPNSKVPTFDPPLLAHIWSIAHLGRSQGALPQEVIHGLHELAALRHL